jgi:predicted transglutaminase-like cysteine proteinase
MSAYTRDLSKCLFWSFAFPQSRSDRGGAFTLRLEVNTLMLRLRDSAKALPQPERNRPGEQVSTRPRIIGYKHFERLRVYTRVWKRWFRLFAAVFLVVALVQISYAADEQSNPDANQVKLKLRQDNAAARRLKAWKALLADKKPRTVAVILNEVNDFFNQLRYIPENPLQGKADVWLTPYEFLAAGGGDCEDFAIAKYFTLVAMGIAEKKLRITYVSIPARNQAHMVLTYYPNPNAEPFILDNIIAKILPASLRTDLVPVYSFNGDGVWLSDRIDKVRPYGKSENLSQWQALLQRIKLEEEN